ncbi:MAG: DUF2059 domain-containing protein [Chitinophagaceae bacterium]|nr:DUF2059 domain-containing protein [Chitinophagaceae bacterium]
MKTIFFILVLFLPFISFSQMDTAFIMKFKALDTANTLKLDTATVTNDVLTKKIKLLRSERNGLTTETILRIKIMEEQQKDTIHPKEFYDKLLKEMTAGKTSHLIENSIINLYKRTFTEKEIDELTNFYKTSAGKKMDKEFILLMFQSVKNAEQLLKLAIKNLKE